MSGDPPPTSSEAPGHVMEFKDYYKVLGVERSASDDEIKKAFRRLARKHHPDLSKATDAAQRMQEINEAYEVLRDPQRRAAYDQVGQGRRGSAISHHPPIVQGRAAARVALAAEILEAPEKALQPALPSFERVD